MPSSLLRGLGRARRSKSPFDVTHQHDPDAIARAAGATPA